MENIELDFTGERFVPGIDNSQLKMEHFQRYLWARQLVTGKNVLDAACGEGYGSSILAQKAQSVIGLDIDKTSVDWARNKYAKQNNLMYLQGSIEKLPLEDNSVDVVVSFETIEHVDEEIQKKYLQEIKRVLRPNGFLVMSTPNKAVYSDKYNYKNEFHVKEFYKEEFLAFLKNEFANVLLYHQFFEVASIIADATKREENNHFSNYCDEMDGKYYIAIASDFDLPDAGSIVSINDNTEYASKIDRILELQDEVIERNRHLKKLDCEIEELRSNVVALNEAIQEKNNKIKEKDVQINEKEKIIVNKNGHIEQLLQKERDYMNLLNTKGVRALRVWWNFKEILFPQGSKRRLLAKFAKKFLRHPIYMLKKCTPSRIKRTLHYMRTEDVNSISNRLDAATLNAGGDIERIKLDLYPVVENITNKDDIEKLVLPHFENPEVSIIIPVYNQFHYTYNCIKSIIAHTENVTYEVILADDCSTDVTKDIDQVVENIVIARTPENMRFLRNCNNAAKQARGEYIFFLNNDTQVQENWLGTLVDLMGSDEKIGMCGSMLLYPNGALQEAGGIVWKDASAWNFGHLHGPMEPEFNYVKEVDYISGAAILIRKNLWKEIGGFDDRFAPAYYEDTDLAFEVRKHGYKVVYQPLSKVVHFEGISNGTDTSSGQKEYQIVNEKKFRDKWKDVLNRDQFANGEEVFLAKDRSRYKKQILVVDHYVPMHDKDAGGKCTFMYLQLFVKMGMKVTFIGDNFYPHQPYTQELNQMGIEVLYGNFYCQHWQEWLKENAHYFDYVYLQRPHISIKYIDLIKEYSQAKILYFAHDLHHVREYREYELTGDEEHLKASEHWKKIEYELFDKTDVGHVVGSYEQGIMQKAFPNKPIRNIPLYMYESLPEGINKDFATREDIMYVGGFGHPPNIDAVLWFGKEVFPMILQKYPTMKWYVVGSKVTPEIQAMASDNIIIMGFVPDDKLEELYRNCRMAIVPLRVGAGVKGKVVESAYFQIPLITTTIGAEGLDDSVGNMIVEDDATKMADIVVKLYEDYDKLKKMSDAGAAFIEKYFTMSEAERIIRLDVEV